MTKNDVTKEISDKTATVLLFPAVDVQRAHIMDIIEEFNGVATANEILVALHRKHHIMAKHRFVTGILCDAIAEGLLECELIYRLPEVASPAVTPV